MSSERPWESGPFQPWVVQELNNRVNYLSNGIRQLPSTTSINYLSGPRRHWIRAFSNGVNSAQDTNSWGLILKSASTFEDKYGISSNSQIYGYSNDDSPKQIKNPQYRINVPEPGITSFTADVQKNFFITAKLNWTCHSIDQLKAITPYLLTPLITVFVEWGWDNFNPQSLINYTDINELKTIVENHYYQYENKVPLSKGNYEFMVGDVTNFEYSFEDNIIKGFTEIKSRQMLYSGFNVRGEKTVNTVTEQSGRESPAMPFKTQCQQIFVSLTKKNFTPNDAEPFLPSQQQLQGRSGNVNEPVDNIKTLLGGLSIKYGKNLENLSSYIYKFPSKKTSDSTSQNGNDQSAAMKDYYITLELFVDIMNSLKNQNKENSFLKNFFEMDVMNAKAGYHKNLISTNRTILIPNPDAPKFNGKGSLNYNQNADDVTRFFDEEITEDPTQRRKTGQWLNDSVYMKSESTGRNFISLNNINELPPNANNTLALLGTYNSDVYRNNLDGVLNAYGRKSTSNKRGKTSFDSEGLIKNVYINVSFINDSIIINDDAIDMKEVYDLILKEMNESVCDYWNLEVAEIRTTDPNLSTPYNRLQIVDQKLPTNKQNADNVFVFSYGSNTSIIKKMSFTTSLTNAMANQILYRSFGQKSLSMNNLIDFSNQNQYYDKIKGPINNDKNQPRNSETTLTFLNIMQKYVKFDPGNPDYVLMRVQVFPTKTERAGGRGTTMQTTIDRTKYNIVDLYIPEKEALVYMLNDNDKSGNPGVYCAPIRNVEIEIALMGIAGIRVFEYFKIQNLPPPFTDDVVVFQVRDVNHTLDENGWETRIKASLRPSYNLKRGQQTTQSTMNSQFQLNTP